MMLFIDDARVAEIRRLCAIYPIDGVTTNPTLLERAGGDPVATLREIRAERMNWMTDVLLVIVEPCA